MIRSFRFHAPAAMALLVPVLASAQLFTMSKEELTEYTAKNPFDRLPDGRPKVPDSIIERAKGMSSEEVWAVLPRKGFHNQYADGFQISHSELKLAGRAFTVQFMPVRPDVDDVLNANAKKKGITRLSNQAALEPGRPWRASHGPERHEFAATEGLRA